MKKQIKKNAVKVIQTIVKQGRRTRLGRYVIEQVIREVMENEVKTEHNGLALKFSAPNLLCDFRVNTFSTKEPETLEWIDSLDENSVLWDIGANVGLYSVYAAKKRKCKVMAFEPSVFNLELLARNIFINGLNNEICIVPLALSDRLCTSVLQLTSTDWGGALSTFGESFGWDGKAIKKVFEFQTIGMTMEEAVDKLSIPLPDYIKMDVDGIEHLILKGGGSVLSKVKSALIEINDDFHEQSEQSRKALENAGLVMREKRHSDYIASSTQGFENSYNQIWIRK